MPGTFIHPPSVFIPAYQGHKNAAASHSSQRERGNTHTSTPTGHSVSNYLDVKAVLEDPRAGRRRHADHVIVIIMQTSSSGSEELLTNIWRLLLRKQNFNDTIVLLKFWGVEKNRF